MFLAPEVRKIRGIPVIYCIGFIFNPMVPTCVKDNMTLFNESITTV
jgi:hypothetical protein